MKLKKIKVVFILSIMLISTASLTGCGKSGDTGSVENTEQSVVESAENNIDKLLSCKDAFVGDNSKMSSIILNLPLSDYSKGFELQTSEEPYEITINYGDNEEENIKFDVNEYPEGFLDKEMKKNAMIIFSLVKNVDIVNFNVNDSSKLTYKRDEVENAYGEELEKITETKSSLSSFLDRDIN